MPGSLPLVIVDYLYLLELTTIELSLLLTDAALLPKLKCAYLADGI
jgi:hypothetical protein